jgi:hypothetical protein
MLGLDTHSVSDCGLAGSGVRLAIDHHHAIRAAADETKAAARIPGVRRPKHPNARGEERNRDRLILARGHLVAIERESHCGARGLQP